MNKVLYFDLNDVVQIKGLATFIQALNANGIPYGLYKNQDDTVIKLQVGEGY